MRRLIGAGLVGGILLIAMPQPIHAAGIDDVLGALNIFDKLFKKKAKEEPPPPQANTTKSTTESAAHPEKLRIQEKSKGLEGTTMDVIIESTGNSSDEARQRAQRLAVEKVLGVYVDAQTTVKDRVIAEDEVVRLVNGSIASCETLHESRLDDGTVSGRYKVSVRTAPIVTSAQERLKGQISLVRVSDISDDLRSQIARNREIRDGLRTLLSDYPEKAVTAYAVDFDVNKNPGLSEDIEIYVDVAVQWNQIWLYRFAKFLEAAHTPDGKYQVWWVQRSVKHEEFASILPNRVVNRITKVTSFDPHYSLEIPTGLFRLPADAVYDVLGDRQYLPPDFTFHKSNNSITQQYPSFAPLAIDIQFFSDKRKIGNLSLTMVHSSGYYPPMPLGLVAGKSVMYLSGPGGASLGTNRIYRIVGKVPLSVIEDMDDIVITIHGGIVKKEK